MQHATHHSLPGQFFSTSIPRLKPLKVQYLAHPAEPDVGVGVHIELTSVSFAGAGVRDRLSDRELELLMEEAWTDYERGVVA